MRILLISPVCPLPLEKGGAVRIWNISKHLSHMHEVDLICFIRKDAERSYENELKTVFRNVTFIKREKLMSARALLMPGWKKIHFFKSNAKLILKTLFTMRPLLSVLYDSSKLRELLFAYDREKKYDLIYSETYYASAGILDYLCLFNTPFMLCEQNIEYVLYSRQSDEQSNFFVKLGMQWDVQKMKMEEQMFWKRSRVLGGLSPIDVSEMKDASKRGDVFCLENGVDIAHFSKEVSVRVQHEVLFVGSLSYFQNVDAIKWIVESIWPKIVAVFPQAQLRLVGRGADSTLIDYLNKLNFRVDSSVDDIREAYQRATVLLAPIRAGSGTKYKVLEAMASHLPVVTTRVGAEGLEVAHGKELLIKDTTDELASETVRLLKNADLRESLSKESYEFVRKYYDWSGIVTRFNAHILPTIHSR
jgi:polysaccharide biosynthesis protein PslH